MHALGTDAGMTAPHHRPGISYVNLLRPLCTTGSPIRITNVTARGSSGGMRVTSWAIGGVSIAVPLTGSATSLPGYGHTAVTSRCGESKAAQVLAISASSTRANASMDGVWVHYGAHARLPVQFQIVVCAAVCKDHSG